MKLTDIYSGDRGDKYIEIDLKRTEIENLLKGRYPSCVATINNKKYTVSIGVSD